MFSLQQVSHTHLPSVQAPCNDLHNLSRYKIDQIILKHHALIVSLQR